LDFNSKTDEALVGGQFEIGRIARIPILIDFTFILLVVLYGQNYFTSGNVQLMSAGVIVVFGIAVSILVHEFAHAVAGHFFGVRASHVELNGFGGLCYWATPMRHEPLPRIVIALAGPLSNLVLWFLLGRLFQLLVTTGDLRQHLLLFQTISTLATINFYLFVFNLLPAYPLDGSSALEALLNTFLPNWRARQIVSCLGLVVVAFILYMAFPNSIFLMLLAVFIGIQNWQVLQASGGPPWQRWN
jgi:Zn-dependent protease